MKSGLWHAFPLRTESTWLNWLLLAVPVAVGLELAHASPMLVFVFSALGIIPLAGVLGDATETLAAYSGPAVGGILNATMGNATELIIGVFALRAGHIEVVKASLSGSIIGNLLLVLGLSAVAGGIGRSRQTFSRTAANANTTSLLVACAALIMPAVYVLSTHETLDIHVLLDNRYESRVEALSLWTGAVLIAIYLASLLFMLKTHRAEFGGASEDAKPLTSKRRALISLSLSTVLIALLSEMLVSGIDAATRAFGMTELFVGVIVVAIVGNAAEHSTAVLMARRNQMDLALNIAVGSSSQIALFVAPVLVFLSVALGHPMSLVFNAFEIAAIALSVVIVHNISADGETNWFEGAQLLALYLILAVSFYFVPG